MGKVKEEKNKKRGKPGSKWFPGRGGGGGVDVWVGTSHSQQRSIEGKGYLEGHRRPPPSRRLLIAPT